MEHLFAGAGGLCSGFARAGFEALWATDYDQDVKKQSIKPIFLKPILFSVILDILDLKRLFQSMLFMLDFPVIALAKLANVKVLKIREERVLFRDAGYPSEVGN